MRVLNSKPWAAAPLPLPFVGREGALVVKRIALIVFPLVAFATTALSFVIYRDYTQRTAGILKPQSWPHDLVSLIKEAADTGDTVEDIDVRRVGFVTTYAWRMPSTHTRLKLHKKRFRLLEAPSDGPEHQTLLSHLPVAWPRPSNHIVVYANPLGPSIADDGNHEFVLVDDKKTGILYFFYRFNF